MIETHVVAGIALFLFLNIFRGFDFNLFSGLLCLISCTVGSIISDVDRETAVVGRAIGLVPLLRKFGISVVHRDFFHSAPFLFLTAVFLSPLLWLNRADCYTAFLLGLASHQALDSASPNGIKWMSPFSDEMWQFSPNTKTWIPTGSKKEEKFRWTLLGLTVFVLLPVNWIGPRWILNWGFADVKASIEFYEKWGSHYQLWADFTAWHQTTKIRVQGKWMVIGQDGSRLILRSPDNRLMTIGDDRTDPKAILRADKIHIYRGGKNKRQGPVEIDLTGKAIGEIANEMDVNVSHFLISPSLILTDDYSLEKVPLHFNPVSISGKILSLIYATYQDLEGLEHLIVERGKISLVYTLYPQDIVVIKKSKRWASYTFHIQDVEDLAVKEGMATQEGDLLAKIKRHIEQITLKKQELENTKDELHNESKVQDEKIEKFRAEELELKGKLQQAENELNDYQHRLHLGRTTKSEVQEKANRLQSIQADLKSLALRHKQAEVDHQEKLSNLNLKIQILNAEISELKRKAYHYSDWDGKIHRIITKKLQNNIEVKIFYESVEDSNATQ